MSFTEINVAKDGVHFFATAERSISSPLALKNAVAVFKEKFPATEGYKITVTEWETTGHPMSVIN